MGGMTTKRFPTRLARCVLMLASLCRPAMAQSPPSPAVPDREAVLATVQAFFDTMSAKDVAGARRLLIPEGTFHSIRKQDGKPLLRTFTS